MNLDSIRRDPGLMVEKIEERDTGHAHRSAGAMKAVDRRAERRRECRARGQKIAVTSRSARAGTLDGRNLDDHRFAGILQIGDYDVDVAIFLKFKADEPRGHDVDLRFNRRDPRIAWQNRRRSLRHEPIYRGGLRAEIDANGVAVRQSLHGPTLFAAAFAATNRLRRESRRGLQSRPASIHQERHDQDDEQDQADRLKPVSIQVELRAPFTLFRREQSLGAGEFRPIGVRAIVAHLQKLAVVSSGLFGLSGELGRARGTIEPVKTVW